jgi:hypothetical protein
VVNEMPGNLDNRMFRRELLIACSLFAAGVVISGLSLARIRAENRLQMVQATPPLQGTPSPDDQTKTPAESKPGGERPTTPPPQPARPDPQTQGAAKPVLPQAPAEKIAPPIKEK